MVLEDLTAVGLAWARVFPTIAIVPAFGLRALPVPARGVLGLALAAAIYPALAADAHSLHGPGAGSDAPFVVLALVEIIRGLPVALACAIPLWAATMAGGLVDALRGAPQGTGLAVVEDRPASFGILLSLFASAVFLSTGGASRAAGALAVSTLPASPLEAAAHDIAGGIGLAVAIGAPILAAALVLEVAFALVARAASPAQIHALLAPIRALGLLAVVAIVSERLATLLATAARQ